MNFVIFVAEKMKMSAAFPSAPADIDDTDHFQRGGNHSFTSKIIPTLSGNLSCTTRAFGGVQEQIWFLIWNRHLWHVHHYVWKLFMIYQVKFCRLGKPPIPPSLATLHYKVNDGQNKQKLRQEDTKHRLPGIVAMLLVKALYTKGDSRGYDERQAGQSICFTQDTY